MKVLGLSVEANKSDGKLCCDVALTDFQIHHMEEEIVYRHQNWQDDEQ